MATAEVSLSGAKNSSGVSAHGVVRPESGWQETASTAREAASRALHGVGPFAHESETTSDVTHALSQHCGGGGGTVRDKRSC